MDPSSGGCSTPPPWHIDAVGGRPHHQGVVLSNDLAANVIRSAGQAVNDITFTLSNDAGNINGSSAAGQLGNVSGNPNLGLVTYVSGSPTRWLGAGGQGDFSVAGAVVT